jgi:hypothetical protein
MVQVKVPGLESGMESYGGCSEWAGAVVKLEVLQPDQVSFEGQFRKGPAMAAQVTRHGYSAGKGTAARPEGPDLSCLMVNLRKGGETVRWWFENWEESQEECFELVSDGP